MITNYLKIALGLILSLAFLFVGIIFVFLLGSSEDEPAPFREVVVNYYMGVNHDFRMWVDDEVLSENNNRGIDQEVRITRLIQAGKVIKMAWSNYRCQCCTCITDYNFTITVNGSVIESQEGQSDAQKGTLSYQFLME